MPKNPAENITVDAVEVITCATCGHDFKPGDVKPMAPIACPQCNIKMRVPGAMENFVLNSVLGHGSTGVVFRAKDTSLGRTVALKLLPKAVGPEDEVRTNFLTEARALAAASHPNVVTIHSIGEYDEQPYIVMELIEGAERLQDFVAKKVPLDERRAMEIMRDVCEGLNMAAKMGLVHGDIKPQNILITRDQHAKVVDFGLVRKSASTKDAPKKIIGTPYYIAPEVVKGKPPDYRADMFSLGATIWHLLTATPPYQGQTVKEVVLARMEGAPPDPRSIRPELNPATTKVLTGMMEVDPSLRYTNFEQLIADINATITQIDLGPKESEQDTEIAHALGVDGSQRPEHEDYHTSRREQRKRDARHARRSRRHKNSATPAILLLIGFLCIAAIVTGGVIAYNMKEKNKPVDDPDIITSGSGKRYKPETDDFSGDKLAEHWEKKGAVTHADGKVTLTCGSGVTSSITRKIGPGEIEINATFDAVLNKRYVNHFGIRIEDEVNNGFVTSYVLIPDGEPPIIRAAPILGDKEMPGVDDNSLTYAPSSITFRLKFDPSDNSWRVWFGSGTPDTTHKSKQFTKVLGNTDARTVTFYAYASGDDFTDQKTIVHINQITLTRPAPPPAKPK